MASVHRRKGSRFWWGAFWHGRKKVFRSTGQEDRARALLVAMAWEEAATGRVVETRDQARRVMAELLDRALGQEAREGAVVSVAGYVEKWLAEMEGTVKASTLAFYRGTLGAFVRWLGERAGRGIDGIVREDVVAWRADESRRVVARTVNHRLKAVRALFRAALRDGWVRVDPTEGLRVLRSGAKGDGVRRPFSGEEFARVMSVAEGDWRLMVLLGLQTGQRLGDLVRMDWRDVDLAEAVWRIRTRKQGRGVLAPLSSEVVELLRARGPLARGPVFPGLLARLGRNGEVAPISKDFGHLLFKAGLRSHSPYDQVSKGGRKAERAGSAKRQPEELSFHSWRHTARSWLEEAGVPKAVIDALIGHAGETGKIYTTVGMDGLWEAAARLEERAGKGWGTGGTEGTEGGGRA